MTSNNPNSCILIRDFIYRLHTVSQVISQLKWFLYLCKWIAFLYSHRSSYTITSNKNSERTRLNFVRHDLRQERKLIFFPGLWCLSPSLFLIFLTKVRIAAIQTQFYWINYSLFSLTERPISRVTSKDNEIDIIIWSANIVGRKSFRSKIRSSSTFFLSIQFWNCWSAIRTNGSNYIFVTPLVHRIRVDQCSPFNKIKFD